ncbi:TatD family hydrolase [Oleiharenicola lentus]|uniref:TatD family hydrolase n=1 Tax=Oleiharenicola lentus TaxID=2508720 RepID=UPI003F669C8B
MNLYDAHQHFHFEQLTPHRAQVDRDIRSVGLKFAVVNGTNEDEWPLVAALPETYDWVMPSFGVHPWDSGNRSPSYLETLRAQLITCPRGHVGEIGLDRWIIDGVRPDDPRIAGLRVASIEEQSEVFAAQLALAAEFNRAASIHCVQAWGALLDSIRKNAKPSRGFLLHGYPGPAEMIKEFTALGAYYSFNIQLLEPRYAERLENFRHIPADRLLVETDAPTKSPTADKIRFRLPDAPDRSPVNNPANVVVAYEALAKLRGVTTEALAEIVELNFNRLFLS